jgi:serine/threonine protein kinase
MDPEKWREIEEIFHSAAALSPEARPAFLDAHCGADESLRHKLELLLAQSEDGILDHAAWSSMTEQTGTWHRMCAGRRIGPYEIVALLGAGGMGEVYRARDSRLGRDVAIKVLPEHLCEDP